MFLSKTNVAMLDRGRIGMGSLAAAARQRKKIRTDCTSKQSSDDVHSID
jgi:hypothetical protein